MQCVEYVLIGDVVDQPVLGEVERPLGEVRTGTEIREVLGQGIEPADKGGVQGLVGRKCRVLMLAHEGLFRLEVPLRIVAHEVERLRDPAPGLAVEDAFIEAVGGGEKAAVLFIDLGDADRVDV